MESDACSGAPSGRQNAILEEKTVTSKLCSVCKETLEGHFGPTGPGRCFGKTVESSFRTFTASIAAMTTLIGLEASKAADREQRLNTKISMLTKQLGECKDRENMLLEKITGLEEMFVAQSHQDDAVAKKKKKKARKSSDSEHKERKSTDPDSEVEGPMPARAEDHATNCVQTSIDASDQPSLLQDSPPLEGDRKNETSKTSLPRSTVAGRSHTTRSSLPEWDGDSHAETNSEIWQLVCDQKPTRKKKVFYIGSLAKDCTAQKLQDFVERRASATGLTVPKLYNITMFEKNDHKCARMIIDAASATTISTRNFWPRPLYARSWNFEKYADSVPGSEPATANPASSGAQ